MKKIIRKILNTKVLPLSRVLNLITLAIASAAIVCIFSIETCPSGQEFKLCVISLLLMGATIIFNLFSATLTRFLYYHGFLKKKYVVRYFREYQ